MRNYRGKRENNGEWIEGYQVVIEGKDYIVPLDAKTRVFSHRAPEPGCRRGILDFIEVIPSTVAQSTGLKDKNKVKIYGSIEINGKMSKGGDIVKRTFHYSNDIGDSVGEAKIEISEVKWKEDKGLQFVGFPFFPCDDIYNIEVLGNQTDNPELLEAKNG